MIRVEGNPSLSIRVANPNRDQVQDSHPHFGKVSQPEDDVQGHVKVPNIREVPTAYEVVRATRGVNSCSAQISLGFFDVIDSSSDSRVL